MHPPSRSTTDETTIDRLAGEWWIHQLRRGHRYASDDVLTAWFAVDGSPAATTVLDLGSGVGAIGLLALLCLGAETRLTTIEVQETSVALLRETVARNGIADRVTVHHGDLRNAALLPGDSRFELITANPPYLPAERSSRSPYPQRATARLELNGDVFDYCHTAARRLAPGGRFCFCHRAGDARPERAVAQAGLSILARREVVFREGRAPALILFRCGAARPERGIDLPPLVVRDGEGRFTEAYRAVRRAMWIEE